MHNSAVIFSSEEDTYGRVRLTEDIPAEIHGYLPWENESAILSVFAQFCRSTSISGSHDGKDGFAVYGSGSAGPTQQIVHIVDRRKDMILFVTMKHLLKDAFYMTQAQAAAGEKKSGGAVFRKSHPFHAYLGKAEPDIKIRFLQF